MDERTKLVAELEQLRTRAEEIHYRLRQLDEKAVTRARLRVVRGGIAIAAVAVAAGAWSQRHPFTLAASSVTLVAAVAYFALPGGGPVREQPSRTKPRLTQTVYRAAPPTTSTTTVTVTAGPPSGSSLGLVGKRTETPETSTPAPGTSASPPNSTGFSSPPPSTSSPLPPAEPPTGRTPPPPKGRPCPLEVDLRVAPLIDTSVCVGPKNRG